MTALRVARSRPLFAALSSRDLDWRDLAQQCGVEVSTVYAWNAGTRRPDQAHTRAIAALIGREATRELYELTSRRSGRGPLPTPESPRLRRSIRATCAELERRGARDFARMVQIICAAQPAASPA